jgi:hypothetical protein
LKPKCSQVGFEFEGPSSRKVAQKFNGGRIDQLRRRRPAIAASGVPHGHSRTFRWLLRRPPRRGRIQHSVPNWPHSKRMRWRLGYDDLNTDDPILWLTGGAASFMATMATTAICRCTFSRASICCGRLQPCNIDASAGSREEVERIVTQIRARWPEVRIILRADSGFCRNALMRQPNPLYSGWPGIRDCVNSLARTRPKRVRYTSKRSRPPACSPEFAEQNRLRARRPDSVPRGTCLAYLKREARLKRLKKAADRIDFSSTRSKPLGVSDIRSGSTARYELCCFTWNMFDSMFHVEPHSL